MRDDKKPYTKPITQAVTAVLSEDIMTATADNPRPVT
jgi:hypothetical protein